MSCNAGSTGKVILTDLVQGKNFDLPDVDFSTGWDLPQSILDAIAAPVSAPTLEDLTIKQVGGTGSFDVIMSSIRAHLREEFEAGRIVGSEYSKTYASLTQAALQSGLEFLMQKDALRWQAITAQINAMAARVNMETAKAQYVAAKATALNAEATYGLTVVKIANEDATHCVLKEQYETARAQTLDTRSDGTVIAGSLGKQKELYSQQITSYKRSSETNAVQILKDAWIAHKSIDEGIDTPAAFNASAISNAINALINNNGLA